jgi:tol-pal system protein YbgF
MKQLLMVTLVLVLLTGCVSNKAFREQQTRLDQMEESMAQQNEELVVLRKEIAQDRRVPGLSSQSMDPEYIQEQFKQNEDDMKSLIEEVGEMALTLDSLGENVVSSDREIVNMIRALETRIAAINSEELSPEQMEALIPDNAQMGNNAREIDSIQAELASLRQQLKSLQSGQLQAASQTEVIRTSSSDEKPEYEAARDEYYEGNFDLAIKKLEDFATKYPRSIYAGNALYWKGESYYAQGKFDTAMAEFQKVISRYPDSWKVADSQLKIGMCHMNKGDNQSARTQLNKVKTDYPQYYRMDIVDKLLAELK